MEKRFIHLYDEYIHGFINRRSFLDRLTVLAGSSAAAYAILPVLENDMAKAQTIAPNDPRITAQMVDVPGYKGLRGYLAKPAARGRHKAVLVIHENRGLNPHIEDVTRRFAAAGYLALGLDYLSPLGGTPVDQDAATKMFMELKPDMVLDSGKAAIAFLKAHPEGNGKVGAVGFCWGGGTVNDLAVADRNLTAGVAYYGRQPATDRVGAITAPLLLNYAGDDERINAGLPAFEAALKANKKTYELHLYPGAGHGFNNDTNGPRFNKAAADLAWSRTMGWFGKYLA
ncbi:MAG TPA: dienelactone hydrolase family protein [Caulobacteraceae bacterium]|jgi:carboxymethylenebutenolidase|nr:dienelactone hydrolase family protein [Caulobacteraceae bacterium]